MEPGKLRLLVVDDHQIVRDGLKALLEEHGFQVAGEASSGIEAVKTFHQTAPDVTIMDLHLPEMDGIEATRAILAHDDNARVVFLSGESDPVLVMEALRAGARGYLTKECAFDEFAQALRKVARGQSYVCSCVTNHLLRECRREKNEPVPAGLKTAHLSPREQEVLRLISDGKSTKEIAYDLKISTKTVENQRKRIMEKLGLYTIADLTKCAVREGISTLS